MESLLERGEKLDDLVAKSEHLGTQSKAFYKTVSADPLRAQSLWDSGCFQVPKNRVSSPAGAQTELLL